MSNLIATGKGSRNLTCAQLAGQYLKQGFSIEDTLQLCRTWNKSNQPPLHDNEISQCVNSVSRTLDR